MPGKYYEDLEVGMRIQHALGRTITEADNTLFCAITMNTQPLHLNEDFAARTIFGRRIVNGLLTLALATGLTVPELTEGTIIANLGYENVRHPNPMFHGDTLYVETEVLEKRPSRSRPNAGVVRLRHIGRKQDGTIVVEFERVVLFLRRPQPSGPQDASDAEA
ncbi:MAG: MaoC family dehydratase [Chloroflexi bacterium]|nr:MaoC family dehydratase [Chloroflexota bacterium]